MAMKSLYLPCISLPSATLISKALLALLSCNTWLSFLTYFTWILLLVNHRYGREVRTHIQIHLFHLQSEKILHYYEKVLLGVQLCETRETEFQCMPPRKSIQFWEKPDGFEGKVGWYMEGLCITTVHDCCQGPDWGLGYPHSFHMFGTTGLPETTSYQIQKQHSGLGSLLLWLYKHKGLGKRKVLLNN